MEKKKLLLVAVSVGVFLVIVMGAAILVLSPKSGTAVAAAGIERPIPPGGSFSPPAQPASVDAADMTRTGEVQGLEAPPPSLTANQENVFYFLGDNPDQIVQQGSGDEKNRVVISVPKPATAAVPDAPPAQPKPAAAPSPARTAPAPARPAPAAAPRTAPAAAKPKAEAHNDFWVQTGSFSTLVRADGVKETLASKGIASIIENRQVEGKTFYRVRLGPYTSQTEANYWLSLIKTIQGFEESQVWQSRR
jgi:DedD protein